MWRGGNPGLVKGGGRGRFWWHTTLIVPLTGGVLVVSFLVVSFVVVSFLVVPFLVVPLVVVFPVVPFLVVPFLPESPFSDPDGAFGGGSLPV